MQEDVTRVHEVLEGCCLTRMSPPVVALQNQRRVKAKTRKLKPLVKDERIRTKGAVCTLPGKGEGERTGEGWRLMSDSQCLVPSSQKKWLEKGEGTFVGGWA